LVNEGNDHKYLKHGNHSLVERHTVVYSCPIRLCWSSTIQQLPRSWQQRKTSGLLFVFTNR